MIELLFSNTKVVPSRVETTLSVVTTEAVLMHVYATPILLTPIYRIALKPQTRMTQSNFSLPSKRPVFAFYGTDKKNNPVLVARVQIKFADDGTTSTVGLTQGEVRVN